MAANALQVFEAAEAALRTGRYPEALQGYLQCVRAVPEFWRARFRVADTLLNFKAHLQALEIYKAVGWHAIKAGQPLQGLVAIKMAAAMDKSILEAVEVIAELYSRDSDRVMASGEPPARRLPTVKDAVAPLPPLAPADLLATAANEAADTEAIAKYPDRLPAIPLFSFLDEDAFVSVLESLQLKRFVAGQKVIEEGQPGDSFFILAEGFVEVSRRAADKVVKIAKLHPGAVFGEMALISKAPRTATVVALSDCDLLELKRASLEHQAQKLASITQALKDFTNERFLTNLTSTSPIFKPFPRSMRIEIIKRFQDFPVDPGDELIGEGEPGQGLYLILKGGVDVTKKDASGQVVRLAQLKEGDVFGEISLLQDSPTTATCTATMRGDLKFLPKREFASLMARHPELRGELAKITTERLQKTKQMMAADDSFEMIEDDDLIML
ncbi:MAG: cyclic nucleotide-binding domain-containing protein [Deltaproteobacteria bacterium]|nr:cyclic nucleotide-binding domain-containing protein [Deltaproteobacteria bacterium]